MADLQKKSSELGIFTNDISSTISVSDWDVKTGIYNIKCKKIGWIVGSNKYLLCCKLTNSHTAPIRVKIYIGTNNGYGGIQQVLESSVSIGVGEEKLVEMAFAKNAPLNTYPYDGIYFQIIDDTTGISNTDDVLGVVIDKFCSVNEMTEFRNVKRLGVQGPPHMWMMINDQGIRIGRSGTFELLTEGLTIDFVCFIPQANDFFLFDYTT